MILFGNLLLEDGSGGCRLQRGSLRIRGDVIDEIALGDRTDQADLGGRDTLICPGFIDAHLHLPQFGIVGAHGMPLLRWLDEVTYPAEIAWADSDLAAMATQRAIHQLLSCGTTGIAAYATVHHESAVRALKVAQQTGIRALIGQVLMDRQAPPPLLRHANELLDQAASLGDRFPPESRVAAAITPRFALSCSEALLRGAGQLAAEQQAMIQSHLAETLSECEQVVSQFGKPYVKVYQDAGLLSPRTLLGHGIHLSDADRSHLASSKTRVVHCPTANIFLNSGSMNRELLLRAQVPLAVGSDLGAGYERSMIRVAREMIQTARSLGGSFPSASEAWYAITAGNADAIGWDDAGRLRVGAVADLLVIRPTIDWLLPSVDPLSRLTFGWDDRWLEHVLLRGQPIFSR